MNRNMVLLAGFLAAAFPAVAGTDATLTADFTRTEGVIKPLHGVNNAPMRLNDVIPEFKEAGIPFVRTHDTAAMWGGTHYVDVPNIFPDFDADPEKPESYDFAFTDAYLKTLVASGCKPFYRLGVTIENYYEIKSYRVFPPKDSAKWAKICAGIVRHYNEGWANGFHYGIKYWEIWNEPEQESMWLGTREQFFELYRVTANLLKKEFPNIKVGGYGSCGFYAVTRKDDLSQGAFFKSFPAWFDAFLKYVTDPATKAPLDFYSWHLYTDDPDEAAKHGEYVAARLKAHGLAQTENIFDEWNLGWKPGRRDSARQKAPGASFVAAMFCRLQRSPVDKAMYYDALPTRSYCGLFDFPDQNVTRTYYSFYAFNELYKLTNAVPCAVAGVAGVYACAAENGNAAALLLANCSPEWRNVKLALKGAPEFSVLRLTDVDHVFDDTPVLRRLLGYEPADGRIFLPPYSVVLLRTGAGIPVGAAAAEKKETSFAGIAIPSGK